MPDGSITPPTFTLSVSDQVNVFTTEGLVSFEYLPVLVNNQINVNQGLTTILNSNLLSASDPSGQEDQLEFVIYDIQQGQFNQIDAEGNIIAANLTRFNQSSVSEQQVGFLHNGSPDAPSYRVAVSDGNIEIPSKPAIVTFKHAPVLELAPFVIDQGRPTINFTITVLSASSSSWLINIFTPTAFLSGVTAVAGYAYNRHRIWKHRQNNHNLLAEYLRKDLNLDIYDFSNGQGMDYANQVNRMANHLKNQHQFSCQSLPEASLKSFASVVAEIIWRDFPEMIRPATCLTRTFNFFACYGKRWVNRMDVMSFGFNIETIAASALEQYRNQFESSLEEPVSVIEDKGENNLELRSSASQLSQPLLGARIN